MKAFAFDVYGTLFDVSSLLKKIDSEDSESFLNEWRRKQLEYSWLLTIMGEWMPFDEITRLALDYALKRHVVKTSVTSLMNLWNDVEPFDDYTYLRNLMRVRKLVALTNGTKTSVRKLFAKYDILNNLDVYTAEDVRVYKPARQVYDMVRNLGEEVYLVSSNSFDIIGAKHAGLKAIYINRNNIAVDAFGRQEPDLEFRSLKDLSERI